MVLHCFFHQRRYVNFQMGQLFQGKGDGKECWWREGWRKQGLPVELIEIILYMFCNQRVQKRFSRMWDEALEQGR